MFFAGVFFYALGAAFAGGRGPQMKKDALLPGNVSEKICFLKQKQKRDTASTSLCPA